MREDEGVESPDLAHPDAAPSSDRALIEAARAGDTEAVSELFRCHWRPAVALASRLAGPSDAEDLVSEAFAKIIGLIARGKGPELAFRPYLMATLRTIQIDRLRRSRQDIAVGTFGSDDANDLEPSVTDGTTERAEADLVARAFQRLPENWQAVLWHSAVDEEPLAIVARRLDMNANSVAALNFRAREGLRQAYLAEHLSMASDDDCRQVLDLIPRYVRGDLGARKAATVSVHLLACDSCRSAESDLQGIGHRLGAILLPALVGVAALPPRGDESVWSIGAATEGSGGPHGFLIKGAVGAGACVFAVLAALALAGGESIGEGSSPRSITVATSPHPAPPSSIQPAVEPKPEPARPTESAELEGSPAAPSASPTPTSEPTPTSATSSVPPVVPEPEPLNTPTAVAPMSPWVDASMATPTFDRADDGTVRSRFPISGTGADLELTLTLANFTSYQVRRSSDLGEWQCGTTHKSETVTTLTCTLPASNRRTAQHQGLDLTPSSSGAMSVRAQLRVTNAHDPNPANNTAYLQVQ